LQKICFVRVADEISVVFAADARDVKRIRDNLSAHHAILHVSAVYSSHSAERGVCRRFARKRKFRIVHSAISDYAAVCDIGCGVELVAVVFYDCTEYNLLVDYRCVRSRKNSAFNVYGHVMNVAVARKRDKRRVGA